MVASTVVLIDDDDEPILDDSGEFILLFSCGGVGGENPIEDISDLVLKKLYAMVMEVQAPKAAADVLNRFQDDGRKRGRSSDESGA